jgi:uncharacterized protein YoaH (UPF0181 family)
MDGWQDSNQQLGFGIIKPILQSEMSDGEAVELVLEEFVE